MSYPISDHFNGETFFNPEPSLRSPAPGNQPAKRTSALSFLLRRLRRDPSVWSQWPDWIENARYPAPAAPVTGANVTFLGHSGFLLRLPGLTVLTDPVFSYRCSPFSFAGPRRVRNPGIALADLPPIDLVLLSHNHYDHMDIAGLRKLRRRFPELRLIAPLGNAAFLARKRLHGAVELDWWQTAAEGEARITAAPARHFAARWLNDRNRTLWASYMLEYRGMKIFFGGDTGYTRFFREIRTRLGAPDLALLPIGAYEPRWFMQVVHMNPADAVQAFQDLAPAQAIGMHFGTFQLTAEKIDQPEKDLQIARTAAGIPPDRFITLDCGETRHFEATGGWSG